MADPIYIPASAVAQFEQQVQDAIQASIEASIGPILTTPIYASFAATSGTPGAALVGTIAPYAGAVGRTQLSKNSDCVTPLDFGAVGNGVADDTAAWQAALSASLQISGGGPGYSYKISGTLALRSGHYIDMAGATMTQSAANTKMFNAASCSSLSIIRGRFVGYGADYTGTDPSNGTCIYGDVTGGNIQVYGCTFTGFSYCAARFSGENDCIFHGNTVTGPALSNGTAACYGVLVDNGAYASATTSGYLISNNTISSIGQGIRVNGNMAIPSMQVRILGNTIFGTFQHGMYVGAGVSDVAITGNTIFNTYYDGIKIQPDNLSPYLADMYNVSISGNVIHGCGNYGINVQNGTTPDAAVFGTDPFTRNLAIKGNTIKSTTGEGINVTDACGVSIVGNSIEDCGFDGVALGNSIEVVISANQIKQCGQNGIAGLAANTKVTVQGNQINDIGSIGSTFVGTVSGSVLTLVTSATTGFALGGTLSCPAVSGFTPCTINTLANGTLGAAGSSYNLSASPGNVTGLGMANLVKLGGTPYGIFFQSGTQFVICDNYVNDANAQMEYGFYLPGANNNTFGFYNNHCLAATSTGFYGSGSAFRRFDNNLLTGTAAASAQDPVPPVISSAATLVLPTQGAVFTISGTTTITTITAAGHCNHTVTLVFQSSSGLTNGNNLKLASNFLGSAGGAITLVCDATNWYEVGRN